MFPVTLSPACSSLGTGGGGSDQKSPLVVENLVADLGLESPPVVTGLMDDNDEGDGDKMQVSIDVTLSDQDYMDQVGEYIFSPSTPKAIKGKIAEGTEEEEDDELPSPTVFDYSERVPLHEIGQTEDSVGMNGEVTGSASSGAEQTTVENGNHVWETAQEQKADLQENSAAEMLLYEEDVEEGYWEEGDAFEDEGDDFEARDSFEDSSEEGMEGSSTRTEASAIEWVKDIGVFAYHAEKPCISIAASTETVSPPLPYTALIQQLQVSGPVSALLPSHHLPVFYTGTDPQY